MLLLFNLDVLNGLANGTRGVVEEFVSFRDYLRQVGSPQHGPCMAVVPVSGLQAVNQAEWQYW